MRRSDHWYGPHRIGHRLRKTLGGKYSAGHCHSVFALCWQGQAPGILWHRGYDVTRIIYQISLSTEGDFRHSLGVSASYVFIFVLFGAFLEITGAGQFYIDFAVKAVGKSAGGPAKAAVVASSLFGTVSGSAVANVAGTGSVTIPLMKSIGYKPEFAAAVEAVASTGGQIMPPLMGAAAFIMAEILGIPYAKVALGALIPALIFYGTVFTMVHCRARVLGLSGSERDSLPPMGALLRENGVFFLPLMVLIYFMIIAQYSVMKAAVYSLLATVLVGFFKRRMGLRDILGAFESGARISLVVIASTACAGIIVAIINLTGLGMKFSSLVLAAGGSNLTMVLIMIMLASLLLGMGLPTTQGVPYTCSPGRTHPCEAGGGTPGRPYVCVLLRVHVHDNASGGPGRVRGVLHCRGGFLENL